MVQNVQSNSNIFSSFPDYSSLNQSYSAVAASSVESIKTPVVSIDKVELEAKQKKKTRRKILFGSTLASTILTAGLASLLLAKGVHGSAFKNKLNKYKAQLAQDIHEASQVRAKDIPSKVAYQAKKGTKKALDIMQASSNITTFKDWGSDQLLRTNKVTRTFADKCTSFFKRVVDGTLGKKYNKVEGKIKDLTSLLKQYDIKTLRALDQSQTVKIKGKTLTLGQCLDMLEKQTTRLDDAFGNNFSIGARKLRDKKRTRMLADLPQKIKERFFGTKTSLFNLENYKTYATEDIAKPAQEELRREILRAKKEVTNNIPSITEQIKASLSSFSGIVRPNDSATRTSVQKLKTQLDVFKNCSGANEAQLRSEISEQIVATVDDVIAALGKNQTYDATEQKLMRGLLDEIKDGVISTGSDSKGALEEILTILNGLKAEKIISADTCKNYGKMAKQITKGMKDATELEMGEYFLKQAELKVGSAPNDVISVLFPVGVGAAAIAKGDDKDEKISATLTTVIPLVGTFATFVYGTVKMLSGAKNLIFSGVSGLALSALGNYADKLYKKYKDSGSLTNVVKDEYNKLWTGLEPQMKQFDEPEVKKTKKQETK